MIEQKIREILISLEAGYITVEDATKAILAALQPTEGELVDCHLYSGKSECIGDTCETCDITKAHKAQLAYVKAQGYVKLPSEEELYDFLVASMKWTELKLDQKGEIQTFYPLRGTAKELLRLLREEGKDG